VTVQPFRIDVAQVILLGQSDHVLRVASRIGILERRAGVEHDNGHVVDRLAAALAQIPQTSGIVSSNMTKQTSVIPRPTRTKSLKV
jgi:hypothetical protein